VSGVALVPTIGLEIHVQLLTRTKMFCGCELEFGAEPNTHTCPVCLGHPGTLPVVNEQAIEYATRIAVALGCEVAPRLKSTSPTSRTRRRRGNGWRCCGRRCGSSGSPT